MFDLVDVTCGNCFAEIKRVPFFIERNKSGNFFCNKNCEGNYYFKNSRKKSNSQCIYYLKRTNVVSNFIEVFNELRL